MTEKVEHIHVFQLVKINPNHETLLLKTVTLTKNG